MRMVLMGTGPFAVPSFEAIRDAGHEIACVITRPAAAATGKNAPPPSPVRLWAESHSLNLISPDSMNAPSEIEELAAIRSDLLVVCDYGQILSKETLAASRLGGINLHGSLLPRHRGAAPVQWSILAGDPIAGVSVIHMTPALDAGPVISNRSTPIDTNENAGQLEVRLSHIGIEATLEAIRILEALTPGSTETSGILQDPTLATRAPRLKKTDGELDFSYPIEWIYRQIRGLQPWPGVFGNLILADGKSLRIILRQAKPIPLTNEALNHLSSAGLTQGSAIYGTVLAEFLQQAPSVLPNELANEVADKTKQLKLGVLAANGILAIESLQPSGKKEMPSEEFLRGYGRHGSMTFQKPTYSDNNTHHPLLGKMMATKPFSMPQ